MNSSIWRRGGLFEHPGEKMTGDRDGIDECHDILLHHGTREIPGHQGAGMGKGEPNDRRDNCRRQDDLGRSHLESFQVFQFKYILNGNIAQDLPRQSTRELIIDPDKKEDQIGFGGERQMQ